MTPTTTSDASAYVQPEETLPPAVNTAPAAYLPPTETASFITASAEAAAYVEGVETTTFPAMTNSAYVPPNETVDQSILTTTATSMAVPTAYLAPSESISVGTPSTTTASTAYVDPNESMSTTVEPPTATPGSAYTFNEASQHEFGGVVVYTWTGAQVFVGTYLPVLVAVLYRALWSILHNRLSLVDPFRQMTRPSGARADAALFAFYHSRSSAMDSIKALFRGRFALLASGIAVLLACILPALASEAIWVDTAWNCPNPIVGSNNPCPARMTIVVVVARILQAILALAAAVVVFLAFAMSYRTTGLRTDPSSIAGIASLVRHPGLETDLRHIQSRLKANFRSAKKSMAGKRYRLGTWEDHSGNQCYGIRPVGYERDLAEQSPPHEAFGVFAKTDTGYHTVSLDAASEPPIPAKSPRRWSYRELALALLLLGAFTVILAYYLDSGSDGFNDFFNRCVVRKNRLWEWCC